MKKKLRMTHQRKAVLDVVQRLKSHPTVDEVYDQVREILPHVSLATVYRNLELLAENGLIRKLDHVGSRKRFDHNAHSHYHVRCTKCQKVEDVPVEPLRQLEYDLSKITGFKIVNHELMFFGICPTCQRKGEAPTDFRQGGHWAKANKR